MIILLVIYFSFFQQSFMSYQMSNDAPTQIGQSFLDYIKTKLKLHEVACLK